MVCVCVCVCVACWAAIGNACAQALEHKRSIEAGGKHIQEKLFLLRQQEESLRRDQVRRRTRPRVCAIA